MNRAEHLQWCKDRALAYVDEGDLQGAFMSMCSDVLKHPDTKNHAAVNELGLQMWCASLLDTPDQMRNWINGYN